MISTRVCVVCGASLEGRSADARVCSGRCRRERGRILAILAGRGDGPYRTLAQYGGRRQLAGKSRANARPGA